jgi:heme-degrading monooxygenase HmoA
MSDTGEPSPHHVLIIHQVADYPAWKTIFDGAADIRKAAGEIGFQVLRTQDDANRIVHFSRWQSLERARRFFESEEVTQIRREAGVHAPQFIYLDELDQGRL